MEAITKLKKIGFEKKMLQILSVSTGLNVNKEEDKHNLLILTKFLTKLCEESSSENEFSKKIIENDGQFSPSVISHLYNTITEFNGILKKENKDNIQSQKNEQVQEAKEPIDIHLKFINDDKEEIQKKFSSLSIPNKNKEELDIELGVIFDQEEIKKMFPKVKTNNNLSPIRINKKKNNNSRERSRSRSLDFGLKNKSKKEKEPIDKNIKKEIPTELVQNGIYEGVITRVEDYGCFVVINISQPQDKRQKQKLIQGFVHISQMKSIDYKTRTKISSAYSIVKLKDRVKVKVISLENNKVTLSMNQVDQITGEDLSKKLMTNSNENQKKEMDIQTISNNNSNTKMYGELTGIPLDTGTKTGRQMNSPELWEINQMKNGKAFDYVYDPIMRLEVQNNLNNYSIDENIDIELKEEEPPFLKGQTAKAGINFSPIRIVKNPDGSLHRAAIQQGEQTKNRRELRELQNKTYLETSISKENGAQDYNNHNIDISSRKIIQGNNKNMIQPRKFHTTSRSYMSIKEQRESLPIFQLKPQIMKMIHENRILVVIGETGSGKTTQITQYLVEADYAKYGKIGCTQPRRVAAMSVAKRVSEEFGCKLGEYVGYSIRFEDCCSEDTIIKYMTDGMLLREALIDKNLTQYSVIMLDEAHERTIHTDILFGLLKEAMRNRNDLKLIVTSATLDSEKFSKFFNNCPVFRIPGRTFDVELFYSKEPEYDYMEAALITVMQIHLTEQKEGDILVFLTGQEEIETACQILQARMEALGKGAPPLLILPVYSALPSELQSKIFEPAPFGTRKCIIATNIAEASLTIDGIYFVVDPGFAKIKAYNPKIGMDSLMIAPISQSSAMQRAGRAGRTGPGKCYRLYTYDSFMNEMLKSTIPEIQRTNLANTVLLLKALGINDLINFEFMDPPPLQTLIAAMEQLYYLGALDEEGLLTKLGRRMAEFPLEPQLSKMLLTSVDLNCSEEIITIVSMLSVQNIFYRPRDKQTEADQKKTKFIHPDGDHLTLLKVFEMWKKNNSSKWCIDNFIHHRAMRKAEDIKKQLIAIMERYKLPVVSCRNDWARVRKAITAGFFFHVARKDPREGYKTLVDNQTIFIHPSSALFNKSPEWVVYHELVLTSKEYMREITSIDPKWLVDVAGKFFKKCNPNFLSKRQKNEKIEPLQNKYDDPNAWRLSKRRGIIY